MLPSLNDPVLIGDYVVLFLACALCAAAGVGGGGIIVPILNQVFFVSYKQSTVLSSCTLVGNYISQVMVNWPKRHPSNESRPLIYWDIVLVLLPCQLAGSFIGTILNTILPEYVLYIVALCVLLFAATYAVKKGLYYYLKENASKIIHATLRTGHAQSDNDDKSWGIQHIVENPVTRASSLDDSQSFNLDVAAVDGQTAKDKVEYPWKTIGVMLLMWVIYCIFLVLSTIRPVCSVVNVAMSAALYPPLILTVVYGVYTANQQQVDKPSSVLVGDIKFMHFDILPPIAVFVVGIICSLLGIGGSELTSPLLLYLGVLPQVSSATVSMMSFWSNLATVIHDIALGKVEGYEDIAGILCCVAFLAGTAGRSFGIWFSTKFGRASFLVFTLCVVLYLTCIFYIYELASTVPSYKTKYYCNT